MFVTKSRARAATLALAVMSGAFGAAANPALPTAVDLLFEKKHLVGLEKGAELRYRVERKVSDPGVFGAGFSDDVKIKVNSVSDKGSELLVNIFTGERARDPMVVPDLTGNPLLLLFLDRCVKNFQPVGRGDLPYLKGVFRTALRDKADIEPVKLDYEGKAVDGYKVTVAPYVGDRNAAKMQGYEGSKFTFVVSEAVPGQFVEFVAEIQSKEPNAATMEERFTFANAAGQAAVKVGEAK